MSQQFKTPGEVVKEIVNQPLATARANVQRAFKIVDAELSGLGIEESNAVFSMLQATQQMRNQIMQGAMQDHGAKVRYEQQVEQEKKQAELERAQREAEEANRPRLEMVTQ